jgi:membrane associated rhomboid family serine protease
MDCNHRYIAFLAQLLLSDSQRPQILLFSPEECRLLLANGKILFVLVDDQSIGIDVFAQRLQDAFKGTNYPNAELVLFSDRRDLEQTLKSTVYQRRARSIEIALSLPDGVIWSSQRFFSWSKLYRSLKLIEHNQSFASESTLQRLQALYEADKNHFRAMGQFQKSFGAKPVIVSWLLLSIMVLMFGLCSLWGDTDYIPTLYRMGANARSAVFAGEWWRVITSIFLHAGMMHLLFNGYVLYALGPFFERIFGPVRFLTLFLFSGVVGNIASLYLGKAPLSVGASGALWGLFGASVSLILRPSELIPEILRVRIRRVTIINILLNAAVSFLPMVDLWAHFGGGVAGFALGLFYVQMPPRREQPDVIGYNLGTLISAAFAILVAFAFYLDMAKTHPWELRPPLALKSIVLPNTRIVLETPKFLGQPLQKKEDFKARWVIGEMPNDPLSIEITVEEIPEVIKLEAIDAMLKGYLDRSQSGRSVLSDREPIFSGNSLHRSAMVHHALPDGGVFVESVSYHLGEIIHMKGATIAETPSYISNWLLELASGKYLSETHANN